MLRSLACHAQKDEFGLISPTYMTIEDGASGIFGVAVKEFNVKYHIIDII